MKYNLEEQTEVLHWLTLNFHDKELDRQCCFENLVPFPCLILVHSLIFITIIILRLINDISFDHRFGIDFWILLSLLPIIIVGEFIVYKCPNAAPFRGSLFTLGTSVAFLFGFQDDVSNFELSPK